MVKLKNEYLERGKFTAQFYHFSSMQETTNSVVSIDGMALPNGTLLRIGTYIVDDNGYDPVSIQHHFCPDLTIVRDENNIPHLYDNTCGVSVADLIKQGKFELVDESQPVAENKDPDEDDVDDPDPDEEEDPTEEVESPLTEDSNEEQEQTPLSKEQLAQTRNILADHFSDSIEQEEVPDKPHKTYIGVPPVGNNNSSKTPAAVSDQPPAENKSRDEQRPKRENRRDNRDRRNDGTHNHPRTKFKKRRDHEEDHRRDKRSAGGSKKSERFDPSDIIDDIF